MLKTKISKKSIPKRLLCLLLSIMMVLSGFVGVNFTASAEDDFKITGYDIINEACGFLGTDYYYNANGGCKHYSDQTSYNGGSFLGYNSDGDCSGLVYATLMNLGITIKGINNKYRVPWFTKDWADVESGKKITVSYSKSNAVSTRVSLPSGTDSQTITATYVNKHLKAENSYNYVKSPLVK